MENTIINNENQEVKGLNFFQRVTGIIVSPRETMKDLVRKPRILFPMLLMVLSVLLYQLLRFDLYKEFLKYVMQMSLQQQGMQISPEQLEASMGLYVIFGMAGAPLGAIIAWIAGSAILLGIMKIFKGEGSFKQYLSVTGYAYVIYLLYLLVSLGLSYSTGELYINDSPALFASGMKGTMLYGFLRGIGLFTVWQYIVAGIGVVELSKVSRAKVYSLMAIFIVIVALIGANGARLM